MSEAVIAQKNPYPVDVVEGKTYYWCQCGLSKKQPFCDSSHKETSFNPISFKATETKTGRTINIIL